MCKDIAKKQYTGSFKQEVIETMRAEKLSYCEAARRFGTTDRSVCTWDKIYVEEGAEGLYVTRRRPSSKKQCSSKSPKSKLDKNAEQNLIAENQYLRAENDYLKNLHALVSKREHRENEPK